MAMGIAGFVLSMVGLVFCWTIAIGLPALVLGVIFSFIGMFKEKGRGLAIAGFVIGLVVLIPFGSIIALEAAGDSLSSMFENAERKTASEKGNTVRKISTQEDTGRRAESDYRRSIAEAECRVSMAQFSALYMGMTYSEAVRMMGCPGTELSRTEMAGYTTVMYQWKGSGSLGANMNAMFQNSGSSPVLALVSKAQFGLR